MHLYGPLVLHWCRRASLADHDAQDVCQEVFGSVAKGLASFRRDRSGDTFRGWLRTITRNKLTDFWRRNSNRPDAVGGSEHLRRVERLEDGSSKCSFVLDIDDGSDHEAISQESSIGRRALEFIREEFEERTWQAFWRTAIDGQKATDVAEELKMSAAAVRKAKSRVLGRLRTELAELVDFH